MAHYLRRIERERERKSLTNSEAESEGDDKWASGGLISFLMDGFFL